jgi:hypothetical protein
MEAIVASKWYIPCRGSLGRSISVGAINHPINPTHLVVRLMTFVVDKPTDVVLL